MFFLISCGIFQWENVFLMVFQKYLLWRDELTMCAWFSIIPLYPYHRLMLMFILQ